MATVPEGLKKAAVLCVLRHDQEFLLLKRLKEPNKDLYTPVGGKLDPYESPRQAAIRETKEETGIDVPHLIYCGTLVETSSTKYNWISFVYLANIKHILPPPCNEGELRWISFEEVLNVPTPSTDWHIYHYILENRPFAFHADFDGQLQLLTMVDALTEEVVYRK